MIMKKYQLILGLLLLGVIFTAKPISAQPSREYLIEIWNLLTNKALVAYNSENYTDFRSCFADSMSSAVTKSYFKEVFLGTYKKNLGFVESVKFLKNQSSLDPDFPTLLYSAEFEKYKQVLITVNFMNENGRYRITQLRFDKQYLSYE